MENVKFLLTNDICNFFPLLVTIWAARRSYLAATNQHFLFLPSLAVSFMLNITHQHLRKSQEYMGKKKPCLGRCCGIARKATSDTGISCEHWFVSWLLDF